MPLRPKFSPASDVRDYIYPSFLQPQLAHYCCIRWRHADLESPVPVVIDDNAMLRVYMSMVLMWYASVIIGCDRRRTRLSDAPLHITQDTSRTENYPSKDTLKIH